MKFPAYPKYKPSGVEWLGDVPKHWEVKRLKWVGESIIGLTYSPTDVVNEGEGTLVLRSSNIQGGRIVFDDNVFVSAEIPRRLRTRPNDIVICTRNGSRDLVGKTGKISERDAGLTFGAFTAVFRSSSNAYMFYVFNSSLFSFQAGLYQTSTIFQLTNGTINAFQIPLPPSDEQQAIADFLDAQTARLDALLSKRRALIEKLSEKRIALISRTVTRGLNPNVKLKSSGIEWLGDVPEHWQAKPLKYAASIKTGFAFSADEFTDEGIPVLRIGDITQDGRVDLSGAKFLPADFLGSNRDVIVRKHDIVMAMTGATIGKVGRYNFESPALLNQRVCIFRSNLETDRNFLWFILNTEFYFEHVALTAFGGAQPNISDTELLACAVPFPPLAEQIAIVEFLDRETAKLDQMMEKVEAAIGKLQEYRTALITAAVTGKIDVRKATA